MTGEEYNDAPSRREDSRGPSRLRSIAAYSTMLRGRSLTPAVAASRHRSPFLVLTERSITLGPSRRLSRARMYVILFSVDGDDSRARPTHRLWMWEHSLELSECHCPPLKQSLCYRPVNLRPSQILICRPVRSVCSIKLRDCATARALAFGRMTVLR